MNDDNYNDEAWKAMQAAEEAYLVANGWVRQDDGRWLEPREKYRHKRVLSQGHAVNSQKNNDRFYDRFPRLKEANAHCGKIRQLIADAVDVQVTDVRLDNRLTDFEFDSLVAIELTLAIEETFDIDVSDEELAKLSPDMHVAMIVHLVKEKIDAKNKPPPKPQRPDRGADILGESDGD